MPKGPLLAVPGPLKDSPSLLDQIASVDERSVEDGLTVDTRAKRKLEELGKHEKFLEMKKEM